MVNWFSVLGVNRASTRAEIDVARRALALEAHPDHGGTQEAMARLNEAHRTLTDPQARTAYLLVLDSTGPWCGTCGGAGVLRRQRGFTAATITTCPTCRGSGVLL